MKTLKPPTAAPLKKTNPWGRPPQATPTVCSLAAVMDEELAKKLQNDEEQQSRSAGGDPFSPAFPPILVVVFYNPVCYKL